MIESVRQNAYLYTMKEEQTKRTQVQTQQPLPQAVYDATHNAASWQGCCYEQQSDMKPYRAQCRQSECFLEETAVQALYACGYQVDTMTEAEVSYHKATAQETHQESWANNVNQEESTDTGSRLSWKIKRLQEEHDGMYRYAAEQPTLTINDLYSASYTGDSAPKHRYAKEDVITVLGYNGLEATKANTWAAEKLMQIGQDVNKDTVLKLQNAQAAIKGLDIEDTEGKTGNEPIVEEEKVLYTEKTIQEIVDDLTEVDEDTIEEALAEEEVTIGNLRAKMLRNTERILHGKEQQQPPNALQHDTRSEQTAKEDAVTQIKEQIKSIRKMLTTESAQKLSEKMPLESSELQKVVEGLAAIQDATIEDAAQKVNLTLTPDTRETMQDVMAAVNLMKQHPLKTAQTIQTTGDGEQVVQEGVNLEQVHTVLQAYEEVGTVPEQRFGETIGKLDDVIKDFLVTNHLPEQAADVEAAKALVSAEIPLTPENLQSMKGTMQQMNTILTNLTPYEAAALIKEGINPYKVSLTSLVDTLQDKQLTELKQSIAQSIIVLEDKGTIDQIEKESLIGLYRILEGVRTHKEEVAGYLYKNNMPLTVEKLEEAIKYGVKNQKVDRVVDDQLGELDRMELTAETARQKMAHATTQIDHKLTLAQTIEQMTLPEAMGQNENAIKTMLYPFLKNIIKETLGKHQGLEEMPQALQDKVACAQQVKGEVLQLIESYKLPTTLNTIYWMDALYKNPDTYKELLKEAQLLDEEQALPEDLAQVEEVLKEHEKDVAAHKDMCMQQGDLAGYKQYQQLEEVIHLHKQLADKETFYQIPFMVQGETKMVNLYIHQKSKQQVAEKERLDAVISYDTPHLGTIKGYISLGKETMKYQIVGETPEATAKLEQEQARLGNALKAMGYALQQAAFETEHTQATNPVALVLKGESQFETIV